MTENEQQDNAAIEEAKQHERMRWHAVYAVAAPSSDEPFVDVRVEMRRYKVDIEKFIAALPVGAQLLYVFQGHQVEFKPRRVYDLGERVVERLEVSREGDAQRPA